MATTETLTTGRVVGTSVPRKGPQARHRQRPVHRQHQSARTGLAGCRPQPYAHADRQGRPRRGAQGAGGRRRVQRRGARRRLGRLAAVRVAGHRGDPDAATSRSPSTRRVTGDGVAVVVAETRSLAKDAAELVEVEYEPLGAVTDVAHALDDGAPLVHDDLGTNECYVWKLDGGGRPGLRRRRRDGEAELSPAAADPAAMEPRGALAQELPGTDELTLWSSTQIPHIAASRLRAWSASPRPGCA